MRFYTQQHEYDCGIDLHARTMKPKKESAGKVANPADARIGNPNLDWAF